MIRIAQPIIANPMLDTVFKRLMENERMVRFFIGTILGKPVEKLRVGHGATEWLEPQEKIIVVQANRDNSAQATWRQGYDFEVLVKTDKYYEEIQITIQKYCLYASDDEFFEGLEKQFRNTNIEYPPTSIYILNFILSGMESACISQGYNTCTDLVNAKPQIKSSPYLDLLRAYRWDSYVIQTQRIVAGRSQTDLDKLLGIFEQRNFVANGWLEDKILKRYSHHVDNEDLREIVDFLHYLATDPDERRLLEIEHEYWRAFNVQLEARREERREKQEQEMRDTRKSQSKLKNPLSE